MSWSQDHFFKVLVWSWTQPCFYFIFPQSQISRQFILSYFKTSQDHDFKDTVYRLKTQRIHHFSGQYQCRWFAGATFYCVSCSVGLALHLVLTRSQPLKVLVFSGSWLGLSSSGLNYNINSCYTDCKCTEGWIYMSTSVFFSLFAY